MTLTFLEFVGSTNTDFDFVSNNRGFFGASPSSQRNAPTDLTPFMHISASEPSVLKNLTKKS